MGEKIALGRNLYFDSLKFVLIVLVILGHTLEQFGGIDTNRWSLTTYFSIYTFHMPLFVFISGYFTSANKVKTLRSTIHVFEAFVIFQVIRLFLKGDWSFQNIITPQWTLWYLLSLCFWKLLTLVLPSKLLPKYQLLVISASFLLSILAGLIPLETELSFQRTFNFFPFFIMGYYAKTNNLIQYVRNLRHYIPSIVLIVIVLSIFVFNQPLYSFLMFQSTPTGGGL